MSLNVPCYRPYNKHNTNIHAPAGFEPTIPASKRPQTHALDRAATGIGINKHYKDKNTTPTMNRECTWEWVVGRNKSKF
jgi:hypothetical protein